MDSQYDVVIEADRRIGYVFDDNNPAKVEDISPTLNATALGSANAPYTAADTDPPYPLDFNSWHGGSGQYTLDVDSPNFEEFWTSANLDPSSVGQLTLGPKIISLLQNSAGLGLISNSMTLAGNVWAAFTKNTNGDQIRKLTIQSATQTGASQLPSTAETTLTATAGLGVCWLFSPSTGEVIRSTSETAGSYTVTRAQCGTKATPHQAGEIWWCFRWDAAVWATTPATTPPSTATNDLETDGLYVYAATDGEGVYRTNGITPAGSWAVFSGTAHVKQLCYCNGYMYGVYSDGTTTWVGYFDGGTPSTLRQISGVAMLAPGVTSIGLVRMNNFVYWLVTGVNGSSVYQIQHSTADTFNLVKDLPPSFLGTSILAHLDNIYIGGYTNTGSLFAASPSQTTVQGSVYVITGGTNFAHLFSISDDVASDTSVLALAGFNRFVYALSGATASGVVSKGSVWRYDLDNASYHHYCDCPVTDLISTVPPATKDFDWKASPGNTLDSIGFTKVAHENSGVTSSVYKAGIPSLVAASATGKNNYALWYKDDAAILGNATIGVSVQGTKNRAGEIGISNLTNRALVRVKAVMSGKKVVSQTVLVAKWDTTNSKYIWVPFTGYGKSDPLDIWIALSPQGADIYIGTVKLTSVASTDLPPINNSGTAWQHSSRAYVSVGWPGETDDTLTVGNTISYPSIWWASKGSWIPGDPTISGTVLSVPTDMTVVSGRVLIAIPSYGLVFADPAIQAAKGWVRTSQTTIRTGAKSKNFHSAIVTRPPLQFGQTLTVDVYVDDSRAGHAVDIGPSTATQTTAVVGCPGGRVYSIVQLEDSMPLRPANQKIKVSDISVMFNVGSPGRLFTFTFNCSKRATLKDGNPYDEDSSLAISNLFGAANTFVDVESLYGTFTGYVESVSLQGQPSDPSDAESERGTVQIVIREVPS
jgi:hypothetical protein